MAVQKPTSPENRHTAAAPNETLEFGTVWR